MKEDVGSEVDMVEGMGEGCRSNWSLRAVEACSKVRWLTAGISAFCSCVRSSADWELRKMMVENMAKI